MMSNEEIIGLVAQKHGVLISREDPILTFLAGQSTLADECSRVIKGEVEAMKQEQDKQLMALTTTIEKMQSNYAEQSKVLANEVVGTAVNRIKEAEQSLVKLINQNKIFEIQLDSEAKNRLTRIEWLLYSCLIFSFGALLMGILK